jgi:hypothetical protein
MDLPSLLAVVVALVIVLSGYLVLSDGPLLGKRPRSRGPSRR